jgi:hypothetical protein
LGEKIDSRILASNLIKLNESFLHYIWQAEERHDLSLQAYDGKPIDIDNELYKLTTETLNSSELASFAIDEILPPAASGDVRTALDIIWKVYNNHKKKLGLSSHESERYINNEEDKEVE